MDKFGSIARFETRGDAERAGYMRPLSPGEVVVLSPLSRAERLARYDAMYGIKPNKPTRNAAKAARKARRKNRR